MDLSHFKTFCTVIEAGSISKAAKELFVTQPAVSLKIQELEDYYKAQLLDRTNRGVQPTEIGLYVYGEAQKVQALMASIKREIEMRRNPTEDLCIGASSTLGNFALPCTMFVFREKFPGFQVTIDVGNATEVMEKLVSRRVEIGVIEGPIDNSWQERLASEDIIIKKIAETRMILATGSTGRFRNIKSAKAEDLKNLPFLIREKGSGIRATIEQTMAKKKLDINTFSQVHEMHTTSAILSAVSADIGITILPAMTMRKELRHKILKPIRLEDLQFRHDISLLFYEGSMKQSYNAFVELVSNPKERGFC